MPYFEFAYATKWSTCLYFYRTNLESQLSLGGTKIQNWSFFFVLASPSHIYLIRNVYDKNKGMSITWWRLNPKIQSPNLNIFE